MSLKDLPPVTGSNFLQRVREMLQTMKSSMVTTTQLEKAGVITVSGPPDDPVIGAPPVVVPEEEPDLTPPPTPTGLLVTAGISHLIIECDLPTYTAGHGHDLTIVYGATYPGSGALPTFANAVEIAQFKGDVFAYATNPATQWHIWIKWRSKDGVASVSPAGGTNGAQATTAADPAKLIEALAGEITATELHTTLGSRIDLIDAGSGVAGSVNARILTETNARTAAIQAETDARVAAINSEASTRSAAITNEATLRQSGDDSLAAQISLVTAGVAGGFDYGKVWYFDTSVESWTSSGATQTHNAGWVEVDSSGTDPAFISPSSLGVSGATYPIVKARIKRLAGTTGWDGTCFYSTSGHGFSSSFCKTISVPSPFGVGDTAIVEFAMDALTAGGSDWTSNTITQIRLDFGADATDTIAVDWVAIGRNAPGASVAGLLTEQQARIDGDAAEAAARTTLAARVTTAENNITTNTAAISTESTARADADTALSSNISSVSAVANAKNRSFYQAAAPTADAVGDLWFDSDDGNKAYRWNGTAWAATDDTRIAANAAAITTEQAARADGDSANATSISVLSARLANAQTAIFNEAWTDTSAVSRWENFTPGAETSVITDTTYGKVLQVGNNTGNDQAWLIHKDLIPFDPDKLYRMRVRVKRTAGTAGVTYLGYAGVAADGTTLVNVSGANTFGSQHYHVAAGNQPTLDTWTTYLGYTKGTAATGDSTVSTDPTAPKKMHSSVRYLRPLVLVNYSAATGTYLVGPVTVDEGRAEEVSAAVATETSARVSGDNALSTQITNLTTTVNNNTAAITTEQNTRASADTALSNQITTVSSVANAKNQTYRQASAPTSGMVLGDIWFDTDDSNKAYRYDGSSWQLTDDTRIAANVAAIQSESTTRATADGYLGAQYTLRLDVGGVVGGYGVSGTNSGEAGAIIDFGIRSNKFYIMPPSGVSNVGSAAFIYQATPTTVNGVSRPAGLYLSDLFLGNGVIGNAQIGNLAVDNAKIADASISTAKIGNVQITTAKVADLAVTGAKIADASISTAKIVDLAVTTAKIADANITTAKIADASITNAKIVDLHASKITAGTITTDKLTTNAATVAAAQNDYIQGWVPASGDFILSTTTNDVLTLTTTGSPVKLFMVANFSITASATVAVVAIQAIVDGSAIPYGSTCTIPLYTLTPRNRGYAALPLMLRLTTLAAGTHTFKLSLSVVLEDGGSTTFSGGSVNLNLRVIAEENKV